MAASVMPAASAIRTASAVGADTATIGAPLMVAVSAPTALAVRMADAAGITLAAIARADGFEVFTHRGRITSGLAAAEAAAEGAVHVA